VAGSTAGETKSKQRRPSLWSCGEGHTQTPISHTSTDSTYSHALKVCALPPRLNARFPGPQTFVRGCTHIRSQLIGVWQQRQPTPPKAQTTRSPLSPFASRQIHLNSIQIKSNWIADRQCNMSSPLEQFVVTVRNLSAQGWSFAPPVDVVTICTFRLNAIKDRLSVDCDCVHE
jgi:hypothetical protein